MARRNAVGVEGVKGEILATDTEGLPRVEGVQCRHVLRENPPVYEENPSQPTLG